jgi:uncharacterized protein YggE
MLKLNRKPATVVAAVLALVLAVTMIACSGSQEPATPTSEPTKSQAETTKSPTGIASAAEVSTPEPSADAKKVAVAAPDAAPVSQSVAATAQGNGQAGIWVNGIGTKDVEADVAVISIGVESREETVAAARGAAAESMTSVLVALSTLGVADDDIVTTSLNIHPIQVWIEVKDDVGSHNEPRITGYVVNNRVRVTVRDIEMADEVIDKAAEVGGDLIRINNVSFTVGDPAAHGDDIRQRAVEDAKAKAELYAEAFGVELGPVVFMQESSGAGPVNQGEVRLEMVMAKQADASTPIESGDISLSITIQAGFSILPASDNPDK